MRPRAHPPGAPIRVGTHLRGHEGDRVVGDVLTRVDTLVRGHMGDRVVGEAPTRAAARAGSGERGSGTVLTLAVVLLVLAFLGVVATLGAVQAQRVRLQAVADLAALAGADLSVSARWVPVGGRPCERAAEVVAANGDSLGSCTVRGPDTLVEVTRVLDVGPFSATVGARARAGPAG